MVANARGRYGSFLTLLIVCGLLLASRLLYFFLSDAQRFPINTVKISATYQHITRKQLELILASYLNKSFFLLPLRQLTDELSALDWAHYVEITRVWPDTLNITLEEQTPVAIWNDTLMAEDGTLLSSSNDSLLMEANLPHLTGPTEQQKDILQIYQKFGNILGIYGLNAAVLHLRNNQALDMVLSNGIQLHLGKHDLEQRLERFCRAYPAVFADKPEQLLSVDLRYASGMAVKWKGTSNNKREDNG